MLKWKTEKEIKTNIISHAFCLFFKNDKGGELHNVNFNGFGRLRKVEKIIRQMYQDKANLQFYLNIL